MNTEKLNAFLKPEGVVVIGASRDEKKLGYGVARNLITSGYAGNIGLVNPKGGELFGYEIFQNLEGIEFEIDLAVLVIPAKYVPQTLIACSQGGIKNIIIISGGFREAGQEGLALEEASKQIALEHGLQILGPNCIGIIDTHLPLDTTFIQPPMPEPGEIAFISQSGALGAAMIDWARNEGFGFSKVVSLGNQIDLNESDFLQPFGEDEKTKVITMYIESVQNGELFLKTASRAAKNKPIVAMKVGRSEAGKSAASSHTGALAGADSAYEAAFRRSGVLRAKTSEEMFEWAKMLAWSPALPDNNRVAILTNAGGPGVTAADAVELQGLRVAELGEDTHTKLSEVLPAAASLSNPVDMLASASPEVYARCLEILLDDGGVDMVLVIAPPPPMFKAIDIAKSLRQTIEQSSKAVAVSFMGSTLVVEANKYLRENHIPDYSFPERAAGALSALWHYSQLRKRDLNPETYRPEERKQEAVSRILSEQADRKGFLSPDAAVEILHAYEVPVLELKFAQSSTEAVEKASGLGYPVVMKIASDKLSHKSDIGGIALGLQNAEDVERAYVDLMSSLKEKGLAEDVSGVNLQSMVSGGQEVIVGAVRDPVFGPLLMFGSGGVEVEGLGDVRFSTAPLVESEFEFMLENTWAGKKLAGFRHLEPADVSAVKDILKKLGQLMLDHAEISEVEINPVIVMGEGRGAYAVDARMLL